MRFSAMVTVLTAALALGGGAAAQNPDNAHDALTRGRRSFAFSAQALKNGGQAGIGLWRVAAPDHSRGLLLNVSAHASHLGEQDGFTPTSDAQVSVTIGPRARRYFAAAEPVVPFVESGIDLGLGYTSWEGAGAPASQHSWAPSLGAVVGGGAEWFPLRRLSVAGQAGLRASVSYLHSSQSGGVTPSSTSGWGAALTTFISPLMVQIYF